MKTGKEIADKINPSKPKNNLTTFDDFNFTEDELPAQPEASQQIENTQHSESTVTKKTVDEHTAETPEVPTQPINKSSKAQITQKRSDFLSLLQKPQETKFPKTFSITQSSQQKLDLISRVFASSSSNIIDNLISKLHEQYEDVIQAEIKKLGDIK